MLAQNIKKFRQQHKLSQEEQDGLVEKMSEADKKVGGKTIIACNSGSEKLKSLRTSASPDPSVSRM